MKERAADATPPASAFAEHTSLAVAQFGEWRIVTCGDERRIMEFMTAHERALRPERAVCQKPRCAIAEMQFTFGEAARVTEEPGHRVRAAIAVLHALAQNHVAAAFAVNRPCLRKAAHAFCKVRCRCERTRV